MQEDEALRIQVKGFAKQTTATTAPASTTMASTTTAPPTTPTTMPVSTTMAPTTTMPATPAAPTMLSADAGDGSLALSWTAPAGTLLGYDVHYTYAPTSGTGMVANDAAASGSAVLRVDWFIRLDRGGQS